MEVADDKVVVLSEATVQHTTQSKHNSLIPLLRVRLLLHTPRTPPSTSTADEVVVIPPTTGPTVSAHDTNPNIPRMAEPAWQELLRLRLAERNARESAFSPIIEQCTPYLLHVYRPH
jgi:hypothetical protein